jgi:hypothetical protein
MCSIGEKSGRFLTGHKFYPRFGVQEMSLGCNRLCKFIILYDSNWIAKSIAAQRHTAESKMPSENIFL